MNASTEPQEQPAEPHIRGHLSGQPTQDELTVQVERLGARIAAHLEDLRRK